MNIEIVETKDKKDDMFEVDFDKNITKRLKSSDLKKVYISFETLSLSKKLYGKTKNESVLIQKENCKMLLKLFKQTKKVVLNLKKTNNFDGKIYVDGVSKKQNNNDFMLCSMLDIALFQKHSKRLKLAYEYACDYLDKENSTVKMCDFRENHCRKHRDLKIEKETGCCPNFCKERVVGQPCHHKNLACKVFMCDYLENKGFYFSVQNLAVLKMCFSPFERFYSVGLLCRTEEKSLSSIRKMRFFEYAYLVLALIVVALLIIF